MFFRKLTLVVVWGVTYVEEETTVARIEFKLLLPQAEKDTRKPG